jgi:sulfate permease family protein
MKLLDGLPGLRLLLHYDRKNLAQDFMAGVVVTLVLIPSAIAYADLAKCPPDAERIVGICKILNSKDKPAAARLAAAAMEIRQLDGDERPRGPDPQAAISLDQLWSVCRMALKATRDAVPDLDPKPAAALGEALTHANDKTLAQFERLEKVKMSLRDETNRKNVDEANALLGLTWYLEYLLSPAVKLRLFLELENAEKSKGQANV